VIFRTFDGDDEWLDKHAIDGHSWRPIYCMSMVGNFIIQTGDVSGLEKPVLESDYQLMGGDCLPEPTPQSRVS